ncbi:metal-dependent hydrolase [Desulfococcaceae bacterium HSG9]|nr:metal-dependent hydrolase [Desulfococcaceae bacterium HSG9]
MSSPIGHSLSGWVIASYRSRSLKPVNIKNLQRLALYIFIANAPDLDFIPGALMGTPNLYHHGISHSLGTGLIFALVLALILTWKDKALFGREFVFMFVIFSSHLVLDLLSVDGRPPMGIPLFWPLSNQYFMIPILPPVMHSVLDHATIIQFLADVFSLHNLYVVGLEILLTVPFIFMIHFIIKQRTVETDNQKG